MIRLLDKDKLVVLENDLIPVSNDCRLGRYIHIKVKILVLPDKDRVVVCKKDLSPVLNDCKFGRLKFYRVWIFYLIEINLLYYGMIHILF